MIARFGFCGSDVVRRENERDGCSRLHLAEYGREVHAGLHGPVVRRDDHVPRADQTCGVRTLRDRDDPNAARPDRDVVAELAHGDDGRDVLRELHRGEVELEPLLVRDPRLHDQRAVDEVGSIRSDDRNKRFEKRCGLQQDVDVVDVAAVLLRLGPRHPDELLERVCLVRDLEVLVAPPRDQERQRDHEKDQSGRRKSKGGERARHAT
jgi:hypothetical protein